MEKTQRVFGYYKPSHEKCGVSRALRGGLRLPQYMFDGADLSVLQSDKTALGAALKEAGIDFDAIAFGENEYRLYEKGFASRYLYTGKL